MDTRPGPISLPALPVRWAEAKRYLHKTLVGCLVLMAFCLVLGIPFFADGEMFGLLGVAGVPPLLIASAALWIIANRSPLRNWSGILSLESPDAARQATFIPYTRSWGALFPLLMASILVLCLTGIVVALSYLGGDSYGLRAAIIVILAPILAIATLPYLFGYFIRGRKRMGIGLTQAGIYHRSYLGCGLYRWDQLQGVAALARGSYVIVLAGEHGHGRRRDQLDPEESWIATFARYRKNMSHIPAGHLTIHPALAYKALVYYHEHPERRAELGTDAALERIRYADFAG